MMLLLRRRRRRLLLLRERARTSLGATRRTRKG
jgi:hypothetical protein